MKIKHLLREQAEESAKKIAELEQVLASLQKISPQIQKVANDTHYDFEEIESQLNMLNRLIEEAKIQDYYASDIVDAVGDAVEYVRKANANVYQVAVALKNSIRSVSLEIEDIQESEEWERRFGDNVTEDADIEEAKASRALCLGSKPDAEIGASQLASCKSQGLRARDGKKSHKIGKQRVTVGGHKIKGKKYGGPLPDYGTRKDQR
jgi:RNAse (barnase) inhibitor barstar